MKAAIFDFDGTLFDSAPYWVQVINDYLLQRDVTPPANLLSIVKPLGIKGAARLFHDDFHLTEAPQEIAKHWRSRMGRNYHHVIPLKEHARDYIEQLRGAGVSVCLATAMERDFVMPALQRTEILPLLDLVVTIADVNCDKSSAKIFEYCAEKLGVIPSDCMVFEDSAQAASVCSKAGFHITGVFDGVCEEDRDLMGPLCDLFIDSFDELLEQEELQP
jgi:beta-phosphoglucomutase-like phosphatase (HAD superfamily)